MLVAHHGRECTALQQALDNDEMDCFIVGAGRYYLESRADGEEPQNVLYAFEQFLVPHWRQGAPDLARRWMDGMLAALRSHPDANRAIYAVALWVWCYRYCRMKARMDPSARYRDVPEIDLVVVAESLRQRIAERKGELVADTRWAGAAWNSPQGIWGPLLLLARAVRDNLGGPDFVPEGG